MHHESNTPKRIDIPWVLILFVCSFLVSYFFALMSVHELRLENGQSDPRNPSLLGWVMTMVVSVQSAWLIVLTWRIKENNPLSLPARFGVGLVSFLGIVALAALSLSLITITWLKLTYVAEFSPAMKGCYISAGVHIIGFLIWLPVHLTLWCIPWKSPNRQPNPPLNSDPTCTG